MRRILLVLALVLCLSIGVASASYTFQKQSDFSLYMNATGAPLPSYISSPTAGNGYANVPVGAATRLTTKNPSVFTYAAWTDANPAVQLKLFHLLDSNQIVQKDILVNLGTAGPTRMEVSIVGGTPYIYVNGILYGNTTPVTQNPSFISWGGGYNPFVDDLVVGSTDSKYIAGVPTQNGYFIKKDMVTPSASGLYNYTTGALVDSNYMYTTWGRSNITHAGNESIYLINEDTGTVYQTAYTGKASAGTTTWDIATNIVSSSAPYGRYQVKFGDYYSDSIQYIANGATITWDKDSYSQQEEATITYVIGGAYWDTSTYTYSMKIYDGTTWSVVNTQNIASSSGTLYYTFTSDNAQGEYYAVIVATPNVGGSDIWMNYDYASLSVYVKFSGYVNDAETTLPLETVNVSFSQSSIVANSITIADGNYTADGFMSGLPIIINVTKAGYSQYYVTLTPMVAKSITLNLTLNSTTPTYTGLGIGGIARTGIRTGDTITSGYGEPLSGVSVTLKNTTNAEEYFKTTNMAGWYLCDEGTSCFLTSKRPYDVWGTKLGYNNSANYTVAAP